MTQLQHQQQILLATPARDLGLQQHTPAVGAGVMSLSAQQLLAVAEDVAAREAQKWAEKLSHTEQVIAIARQQLRLVGARGVGLQQPADAHMLVNRTVHYL